MQAISPIVGGYIATRLSWQWIFYFLTIMGGVLFLLTLLFLQETIKRPPLEKNPGSLCANLVSRRRFKMKKGVNAKCSCLVVAMASGSPPRDFVYLSRSMRYFWMDLPHCSDAAHDITIRLCPFHRHHQSCVPCWWSGRWSGGAYRGVSFGSAPSLTHAQEPRYDEGGIPLRTHILSLLAFCPIWGSALWLVNASSNDLLCTPVRLCLV